MHIKQIILSQTPKTQIPNEAQNLKLEFVLGYFTADLNLDFVI